MPPLRPFAAFAAVLLVGGPALAQEQTWLAERRFREGPGVRAGEAELHFGLGADVGDDSNYLLRHQQEAPIGALRLRVTPSFAVTTVGTEEREPRDFALRFEVGGAYNEIVPIHGSDEAERALLRDERELAGGGFLTLDILPHHPWSGRLFGGVGRAFRPSSAGDVPVSSARITPAAGAELMGLVDHERVGVRLGYRMNGTMYEASELDGLDNFAHEASLAGHWRFSPRWALLYGTSQGFIDYASREALKSDSLPLRARAGLAVRISRSFVALGLGGWGSSFHLDDDPDFNGAIGEAELRWLLAPVADADPRAASPSLIALGFARDFEESFVGTYLVSTRGYLRATHLVVPEVAVAGEVSAAAIAFPEQTSPDWGNPDGWTDPRIDARLFAEWRAEPWLGVNAETTYTGYFSDTMLVGAEPLALAGDRLGYQRFTLFSGARVFW